MGVDDIPQEDIGDLEATSEPSATDNDTGDIDLPAEDMDERYEPVSLYEQTRLDNLESHNQEKADNLERYQNRGAASEETPLESKGESGGGDMLSELKIQTNLLKQIAEKEGLS